MKITVLVPKKEFNRKQLKQLSSLGQAAYVKSRKAFQVDDLIKLAKGSEIIGADPDVFGGFEVAKPKLTKLMENLPGLKGVALASSSFDWIDLNYCRKRKIAVTNVPGYSTESVAEHTLALMLCLAKNIIVNDRKYQKDGLGKYASNPGFELKGKTLGVIGLGRIGSRVAELGRAIGMNVVAFNRTPKVATGVKIKPLSHVLSHSDVLSINLACNKETYHFISSKEILMIKKGAIFVNLIGPVPVEEQVVDEKAVAKALQSRKIAGYAYEAEDLINSPLAKQENAIGLKGFAWYTKDALDRAMGIWTNCIASLASGRPQNVVN